MIKVVTVEEMRQIEDTCAKQGLPSSVLMENAGKAVAEEVVRITGDISGRSVLVLVGPGNNGGDGLVTARYLHDWGARVYAYITGHRAPDDINFQLVREREIACIDDSQSGVFDTLLLSTDVVVDAFFGTGNSRPISGIYKEVLAKVGAAKKYRRALISVALDLPSGLNADTGAIDPCTLHADHTITLGFPKQGLYNLPGATSAGKITVADIGIPGQLAKHITTELLTDEWASSILPERSLTANKGSFGKVLVIAGSKNYIGAAYLACSGAMRVGAGLVTLATTGSLQAILATKLTETTYIPLPESDNGGISPDAARVVQENIANFDVLLAGCGLGQSDSVIQLIQAILAYVQINPLPVVLDADALNILAKQPEWWLQIPDNKIVLTPHPGEMSRLTGISIEGIQSDRIRIATEVARKWQKTVVLKGAYTVIAAADGQVRINPAANPVLASAGSGDVLAGTIAGLLAQGLAPFDAASCGVYLNGKVADKISMECGDTGIIASDLLPVLPVIIKNLKEYKKPEHQEEQHAAGN